MSDGELGDLVRARRELLGLDQTSLAVAVGVGQQTVSRWEGGGGIGREHLPALADALGVDRGVIFALAGFVPLEPVGDGESLVAAVWRNVHSLTDPQLFDVVDAAWGVLRARQVTAP